MAHQQQREFIASLTEQFPQFFVGGHILEVGSLNINGTVRDFFCDPVKYVGVDVADGPCVDVVCQGQDLAFPDQTFDVTVSAECFEHNPFWAETFTNMVRMTRRGGLVFFTCATEGRKEHGTTRSEPETSPLTVAQGWDYYRNLTEADFVEATDLSAFRSYEFSTNDEVHDLYFWGITL